MPKTQNLPNLQITISIFTALNTTGSNHLYNTLELLMIGIMVPETCWASSKICNKNHLLHLVGILFPHINDDARSKPHKKIVWCVTCPHHVQQIPHQWRINIVLTLLYDLKRLLNSWINHVHLPLILYTFENSEMTGEQGRNMQLLTPEFILREDSHHFEIPHRKKLAL